MDKRLQREYRRFRKAGGGGIVGEDARICLDYARTVLLWERLEDAGLVEFSVVADEDYDPVGQSDDEDTENALIDAYNLDGAWGTTASYRLHPDDAWIPGDSVWGHVGYSDPGSPYENPYVAYVKSETIELLRAALRDRCLVCRQPSHV